VGNAHLHILAPHFNRIKQSLSASAVQTIEIVAESEIGPRTSHLSEQLARFLIEWLAGDNESLLAVRQPGSRP
jgi:hypothetical protein